MDDMAQDATDKKNLLLLIELRWVAIVGQAIAILYVKMGLGVSLPLPQMFGILCCQAVLNILGLTTIRRRRALGRHRLLLELLIDVAALSAQLYLSGGASNPFISLFLLEVILGAVLLEAWAVWVIVVTTSFAFVALRFFNQPISLPRHHDQLFSLHLQGMFICFVLAAVLLVLFMTWINRNLADRDRNLSKLRQRAAEEDHIVRIGLLASGAAHEFGTPLSTLSVILNDWQHSAMMQDPDVASDIEEMQAQVEICKGIVSDILMSSGIVRGEGSAIAPAATFFDDAVREWRVRRSPSHLDYVNRFAPDEVILSDPALKKILFIVFDNALDASPDWVGIAIDRQADAITVVVSDAGPGFSEEMLADVGTPYRSTKDRPGAGLGLFLVANVVGKLGGLIEVTNGTSSGARVAIMLPISALAPTAVHDR